MIPTLFLISVISFAIIDLPPGDILTSIIAQAGEAAESTGGDGGGEMGRVELLRQTYGIGRPLHERYLLWMRGLILRGDFGFSFLYNQPVSRLIWERLGLTVVLSLASTIFIWVVAFPIGLYSAVHQYSPGDYIATFFGFIGRATPNFLLALILMFISVMWFGESAGGLFSPEFEDAPWSLAKFGDLLSNLLVPTIVIGTAGTAGAIRIFRANLLDELNKQYVTTARAKGKREWRLVFKYPVRVAINPFISTMGWMLPELISGATITSIVLNLPTTGPLLFNALQSQDMYLAGSFLMLLAFLTVIGTVISDLLLAWVDPRIRYE
jgi:peptide/nickel transport system permease protein